MRSLTLLASIGLALLQYALAQTCPTCQSFGIDFQNDGSYFQNSLSNASFTALQDFEGCQNDTSHNVLVDPDGNQLECSMTPLTPNDTPQLVTCPIAENALYSGDWSMVVISNNGNCSPIAYERDFYLSVGPQVTDTVTPTVTVTDTITPIANFTSTVTSVMTITADPVTTTVAKSVKNVTVTKQPRPSVTKTTIYRRTVTYKAQSVATVLTVTTTATASCSTQESSRASDSTATVSVTATSSGNQARAAVPEPTARAGSARFRRAVVEGRTVEEEVKVAFIAERHQRLAMHRLNKRAPEMATVTSTATDVVTATATSTAPTMTVTGTTTNISTVTTTPTVTLSTGRSRSVTTTTLARSTITNTVVRGVTVTTSTKLVTKTITVATTTTPADLAASCTSAGGIVT